MRRILLVAAVTLSCRTDLVAQQRTVNQAMIWGAVIGEHRIAPKTAFYWDYHARRADFGETWQLNLGAFGVARELNEHWKVTTALGWSRGYRYGAFPSRSNNVELRPWVQLSGTRRVGQWTWSDRTRAEFRVLRPIGDLAPPDADWSPTVVRLRRMDRFQHKLSGDGRWYGTASNELLVNVLPAPARVGMLEQVRVQFALGRQVTPVTRVETGYGLQRFNRRGGYEMNHTLLLYLRLNAPIR
jgi:hypothetical protein